MCELSMILTLGATLGSTMLGAMGAAQQGEAIAAQSEYSAKVQEMNATISERRARDAIERGEDEEQRKRAEVQKLLGQQKVAYAASGVDLSFGSPLDTIVDTAVMGELDALTIRSNSYREAYDRRVDATNQRSGAEMSRMEGDAAKKGGYLSAVGTVLGGVGKAYGQYRQPTIGSIA